MKRKLVRQGSGAITMTLPIRWCNRNNLETGDEVELEEQLKTITVYAGEKQPVQKKEGDLTIKTKNKRFVRSIIGGLYRRGFDIIRVRYDDEESYRNIEAAVGNIIGYEIVDKRPKLCIIHSLVLESEKEYSATVNKIINTTKTVQELCREDYQSGSHERMDEVEAYRQSAWKMRDYVMRIAVKTNNLNDTNYAMTLVVWVLEKINREYKEFYQLMKEHQISKSPEVLAYFDKISEYYQYFAESVIKRSFERVETINTEFYELHGEGITLLRKSSKNAPLILALMNMVQRIQDISSFLVPG